MFLCTYLIDATVLTKLSLAYGHLFMSVDAFLCSNQISDENNWRQEISSNLELSKAT